MLGTAFLLLALSITAAATPALILGAIVYLFDQQAALYTVTAIFVLKLSEYLKYSVQSMNEHEDGVGTDEKD
jgi:hypothetical protein